MKLDTKNFGEIEIDESGIITFPNGLVGFDNHNKFIIIDNPDEEVPFQWLQSVEDPDLAFVIVNPFVFRKDYEFQIPDPVTEKLEIKDSKDVLIYSIVVVPEDISKMTANLAGPVIINSESKLGKQIIIDNKGYTTKHYILEELQKFGQEE